MAKQSVALECLSYHATASHDDTERLRRDDIPSSEYYNLYRYKVNLCNYVRVTVVKISLTQRESW